MGFAVREVSPDEIPERKEFGRSPTRRSVWCESLLEEFLASSSGIWELCEGIDGPFKSVKEASSYATSISGQAKKKRFKNIVAMQRGRRVFISKVRITEGEKK